ncbi:MAG: hypothetical protein O9301_11025 [Leptospira sp.]|nr:hypothetical protein [Leptospira sp.]
MNLLIRLKCLTVVTGIFTLTYGCLGITKTFPEKKFYLIEVKEIKKVSDSPRPFGFQIRKISISQKFEGKEFVYRKDQVNYESDFYNIFFINPSANIREEIGKSLLASNLFEWDGSIQNPLNNTHYIEIYISQLYGDFREKQALAILDFDIVVYTEKNSLSTPIYRKTFKNATPIQGQSPEALTVGWNDALSNSLQMLVTDLSTKLK